MKVHDLTAESIEQALSMGFDDLDFDDVLAMRIHDITPDFVDANTMGFGSLDMDDVMAMKIHGLSTEYLGSMNALGLELTDFDDGAPAPPILTTLRPGPPLPISARRTCLPWAVILDLSSRRRLFSVSRVIA